MERGLTYSVSLKMNISLIIWNRDEKTGDKLDPKEVNGAGSICEGYPLNDQSDIIYYQWCGASCSKSTSPKPRGYI